MNRLDKRTRPNQRFAWFAVLALVLGLFAAGCGSDGGGSVGQNPVQPLPNTGNVLVRFGLDSDALLRSVPTDVVSYRVTMYNGEGVQIHEPVSTGRVSEHLFKNVNIAVTSFRVEYLLANGTPSGLSVFKVQVPNGETRGYTAQYEDFTNPTSLQEIELTPGPAVSVPAGLTQNFKALAIYNNGVRQFITEDATWASSETEFATVPEHGGQYGVLVTSVSMGETIISATYAGKVGKTTLTATRALMVPGTLQVSPVNPNDLPVGLTQQFTATATFTDGSTPDLTDEVVWTSSDETVATVTSVTPPVTAKKLPDFGLATAMAVGQTEIIATTVGTAIPVQGGVPQEARVNLTVTPAVLVSIAVEPPVTNVINGQTRQYTAMGTFSDGGPARDITDQVQWASSDESIATIDGAGLATGQGEGATGITATFLAGGAIPTKDNKNIPSNQGHLVVVDATLKSIAVTPVNPNVAAGLKVQFVAEGTYTDGSKRNITDQVTWASSAPAIATISNMTDPALQGLATALTVGTTDITATLGGVTSDAQTLEVTPAVLDEIVITRVDPLDPAKPLAMDPIVPRGVPVQFAATGKYSDGTTPDLTTQVDWASSEPTVATINTVNVAPEGLASTVAFGQTRITATFEGKQAEVSLTVLDLHITKITLTPGEDRVVVGAPVVFTADVTYSDGNVIPGAWLTLDWTFEPGDPANPQPTDFVVNNHDGKFTAQSAGVATIRARHKDSGISGTATMNVVDVQTLEVLYTGVPATEVRVPNYVNLPIGVRVTYTDGAVEENPTDLNLTWTSANPALVSFDTPLEPIPGGYVTGAAPATVDVTVTNGLGTPAPVTIPVIVEAKTLDSVEVRPDPTPGVIGGTYQYTAWGNFEGTPYEVTRQAAWSSSNGAVATVVANGQSAGQVTIVGGGPCQISVDINGGMVVSQVDVNFVLPALVSIAVTPDPAAVTVGGLSQAMTATGTYDDASTQNLTTWGTWSLQDQTAGVDAVISNTPGINGQILAGTTAGNANILFTQGAITSPLVPLTINP